MDFSNLERGVKASKIKAEPKAPPGPWSDTSNYVWMMTDALRSAYRLYSEEEIQREVIIKANTEHWDGPRFLAEIEAANAQAVTS
jgi:hypothetical protein